LPVSATGILIGFIACALATQELVPDVFGRHDRYHLESFHVAREKFRDLFYVALLHLAEARCREMRYIVHFVVFDHARHRHAPWHICEFDIQQLGHIDGAMLIPAHERP
jgi:predicted GNAT superfamily acetyltransferase